MTTLVLASASPARLETLRRAGIEPVVIVSDVDEDEVLDRARDDAAQAGSTLSPADAVLTLARAKAEAVAAGQREVEHVILGCDSMLELGGEIFGKPATAEQARERWRAMRGSEGVLHTGHWIVDGRSGGGGASFGRTASTRVTFADLTDDEFDEYFATGEPLRVAGGFTVDGLGGPFVTGIDGDYHNVVGLSLPLMRLLLADIGITIGALRQARIL
jgi:septum formation protein